MATDKCNPFEILSAIDVNEHIEKKNGLSYLSWAWAYTEVKKRYPESFATIYEGENGNLYHTDGKTCWVKAGFTLVYTDKDGNRKEQETIEYLPVMDMRNQSIPLEKVTSMDANKAIQRCVTKAIARHGLGLYIYAGEDMPEEAVNNKKVADELVKACDTEFVRITKAMTTDQKKLFCIEKISPVIGSPNYKVCQDTQKLTKLLETFKQL